MSPTAREQPPLQPPASPPGAPSPAWHRVVTVGFAAAVATWTAAFLTHIPALDLPPKVAGPIVLGVWFLAAVLASRWLPPGRALRLGAASGLLSATLGLLILGALLSEPVAHDDGVVRPAQGLSGIRPGAGVTVLGFLALGAVIGSVGAALGRLIPPRTERAGTGDEGFVSVMAWVGVASVVPLLITGGAVTSTNAGLAIRGWPDSYGANMFLYPISLMSHPAMFLEHTHRLFGSLAGLTTLATMVLVLGVERRRWVRGWAIGLFVLVCIQGVLGGLRVRLGLEVGSREGQLFALFHGVLAQIFLACAVALAVYLGSRYRALEAARRDGLSLDLQGARSFRRVATASVHALFLQLVLGATYRHFGAEHALWTHAGFALIVSGLLVITGFTAARIAQELTTLSALGPAEPPALGKVGRTLVAGVAFQFLLGWVALFAVLHSGARGVLPPAPESLDAVPQSSWLEAVITTTHQVNGAAILALACVLLVWAKHLHRLAPARSQTA